MCSVVILRRPGHDWPVLLAANRDEMNNRPWLPPGRHWPDRPWVVAGLDQQAGGSWLGLNGHGLFAGVMNRAGSLGPAAGKRSRGELVLEALDHADALEAAKALGALEPRSYRPFNMMVADNRDGFWIRNADESIAVTPIAAGLSMLTAHDLNDEGGSRRIRHYLPLFRAAPAPDPAAGDWRAWQELLASSHFAAGGTPYDAMTIHEQSGFETLSSALIALPSPESESKPVFLFAPGRPDRTAYEIVTL